MRVKLRDLQGPEEEEIEEQQEITSRLLVKLTH